MRVGIIFMLLKTLILVVVCLIVGLTIGFGAGALIVQPVTKTSVITESKPVTVTQTQTFTKHSIEPRH
jgi:F0F1-type ATP synthase assembly protein I